MGAAFNGTLLNVDEIHGFLPDGTFETSADTECFVRLYQSTAATRDPFERVREVLRVTSGAFSVGFAFDDRIIVARDPRGFRPLYFARLRQGGYAVASESHVLERMGARGGVSEVLPGEAIEFQVTGGMRREIYAESPGRSSCLFELIYFASVLGVLSGVNVGHYRHHVGRYLAHKEVSERDLHNLKSFASESSIVIPVLNSGAGYASSYAAQLGLSVGTGLVRDGDVRAFLGANAEERKQLLSRKHGLIPYIYDAKTEIIIVDDSLVRSDTMRHIVALVREVYRNARVHVRIATPEVIGPCFFGIATPQASQLIAARLKTDQIRDEIGADSLVYLDYGDLYRAYLDCRRAEGKEAPPDQVFNFCDGCFTGRYPMAIPPDSGLRQAPPTFPLPVL
jgi:amidophosphoribosyltransferase